MQFRRHALLTLLILAAIGTAATIALRSPAVLADIFRRGAIRRFAELIDHGLFDGKALRIILCGTSSPLPDAQRAKSCAVVIAGERAFVVDTGPESWKTLALMGFPGEKIAAVLLTHFHSDHIGGLGEFALQTWVAGRKLPLPVYGGPGVDKVVAGFNQAYALDDGYRAALHGPDLAPIEAAPLQAAPFRVGMADTHDESEIIFDSDGLKITAFDVDHTPATPAVGYRFDYRGRSAVFSGDTKKSPNLALHANNADVLVHEAQSQRMRAILAETALAAGNKVAGKILQDIESYHTSPVEAAEVANAAGVRLLVFSHFTPPLFSRLLNPLFFEGVDAVRPDSGWVAGTDGLRIDLPIGSSAILQSQMSLSATRW
jgi:ribonuclease Z